MRYLPTSKLTPGMALGQDILNPQVKSQALSVVHDLFAFDMKSGAADVPVSEIKIQKTIERIVENILSNGDIMCNVLDIKKISIQNSVQIICGAIIIFQHWCMPVCSSIMRTMTEAAVLWKKAGIRFRYMQELSG